MALVDVDSWFLEYEACERLNQSIISQLTQRDKRQHFSSEYNRLTSGIQVGLKQFKTELQQLRKKLDDSVKDRSISHDEVEHRHRQTDKLQSQLLQLELKFNNNTRTDRTELLSEHINSPSAWQPSGSTDGPAIVNTTDVETLKRRQIDILEDQNRGLEVLSQTLSRQRALASQLGQEVEDQNDILDNLANTMEHVDARVHVETGNIGLVSRNDNTCGYWTVILLLFVFIIIVAVL